MGAVNFSIDPGLVAIFKMDLPLEVFVETGTFEGESIRRVRAQFDEVHSVEASAGYYTRAVSQFREDPKIFLYLGHSPDVLRQLTPSLLKESVLYWLDAHWCVADHSAGETSQCPLLDELAAISTLNEKSVILIDDARLFLCPPPHPHEVSQWPALDSVLKGLLSLSSAHELMVLNDVLICYPASVRKPLTQYAYEHSVNWLTALDKSRDYDLLLGQLKEKEAAIQEKEAAIQEKDAAIQEKETAIRELAEACQARLDVIKSLSAELERERAQRRS
jgi:hypothetical protein